MNADFVTIGLAFIEGFALIISPCILPILPIILSGSFTGNKSRPFGIIVGFIITFTIVTLFSKLLIQLAHINPNTLRNVSFVILFLLGFVMLSSYLTEKFTLVTQRLANVGNRVDALNNPQGGFSGGLIFGGLIGVIWTPCAGPILAAVIVQVVIQQTTLNSVLTVLAFAIGAGLPMLLIALVGRRIVDKFHFFRDHTTLLRKLLGLIIILSVIYLAFIFTDISTDTPSAAVKVSQPITKKYSAKSLINGLKNPYPAPEIAGIEAWINSSPLQINQLKEKVVLIDFWTYSCINCIRTLPYLKDWYEKYHDKGLVIIGVHSPEFEFEHDVTNVKNAVEKDGIRYPVALDNQFVTWRNYHNKFWPAHYLINKKGEVVYESFGEGDYEVTENNIQYLLGINEKMTKIKSAENTSFEQTPETYLGYARASNFFNIELITKNIVANYHYPSVLPVNTWALKGKWIIHAENIVAAEAGASIKLHFYARKVYAVMGGSHAIQVKVLFNGNPLSKNKGKDITNSQITVDRNQLYSIIDFQNMTDGIVEFTTTAPGLEIYTFTFG